MKRKLKDISTGLIIYTLLGVMSIVRKAKAKRDGKTFDEKADRN